MSKMKCFKCGHKTLAKSQAKIYKSFWGIFYDKYGVYLCKNCRKELIVKELNKFLKKNERRKY